MSASISKRMIPKSAAPESMTAVDEVGVCEFVDSTMAFLLINVTVEKTGSGGPGEILFV